MDLLLYLIGATLVIKPGQTSLFNGIKQLWTEPPQLYKNETEFSKATLDFTQHIYALGKKSGTAYTQKHFAKIFSLIKSISYHCTKTNWQTAIDDVLYAITQAHTEPLAYAPDLRYKGNTYVNFERLLDFINKYDLPLPHKRITAMQRLAQLQRQGFN